MIHDYLKIPENPLFHHIFIVINITRLKKMGVHIFCPPMYACTIKVFSKTHTITRWKVL